MRHPEDVLRLAAILLAAVLLVAGCGGDAATETDAPSAPARAAATTVTPSAIAPRAASGEVLLVDVREDPEWAAGRAPDAIHVPLAQVEAELPALRVKAAGRPIAFICRSGRRSAQAAQIAADAGVAGVINVDGGMGAWVDAGLPLVPEGGTVV
jgi:rhodanese-related sulfurtransferase